MIHVLLSLLFPSSQCLHFLVKKQDCGKFAVCGQTVTNICSLSKTEKVLDYMTTAKAKRRIDLTRGGFLDEDHISPPFFKKFALTLSSSSKL